MADLRDGDRSALRVLHERHAPWLTLRLSRRCGDREVVDEAVQDTFFAIWRRPQSYRGTGPVAVRTVAVMVGVMATELVGAGGVRAFSGRGPIESGAFQVSGQLLFVSVSIVAAAIVAMRRDSFEIGRVA